MGTKAGGTFATFLLSVPVAAVGLMAIFGIPQFTPVIASPDETLVIRDPYDPQPRHGSRNEFYGPPRDAYGDAPRYDAAAPHYDDPRRETDFRRDGDVARDPRSFGTAGGDPSRDVPPSARPFGHETFPSNSHYDRRNPNEPRQPEFADATPVKRWHEEPQRTADSQPVAPRPGQLATLVATSETSSRPLTWKEASRKLAELGIEKYHLERGAGEHNFLFVCLFTPGDAPHVTHRFEAEADEPLTAVSQVLQQIESFLQQRFASERFSSGPRRL